MNYPTLQVGSCGQDVAYLKGLLHAKGYHPDSDDRRYYKATAEHVHLYQMRHLGSGGKFLVETPGVTPGVVSEETWRALMGDTPQRMGIKPGTGGMAFSNSEGWSAADFRAGVLKVAESHHKRGVREIPKGANWDNGGVITQALKLCGLGPNPWCAAWIVFVLHSSGYLDKLPSGKSARVCTIWNLCRKAGIAFTTTERRPCPADLFVQLHAPLRRDGTAPNVNGHIGFVAGIGGARIDTYEGNSDDRVRAGNRDIGTIKGWIKWTDDAAFRPRTGARFQSSDAARDR